MIRTLEGIHSRMSEAEGWISDLEDRMVEIMAAKQRNEDSLRDLWVNIKHNNIWIQFSSVAQSCPTLCDPRDCSTPGLPVHHQLLDSTQNVSTVGLWYTLFASSQSLPPFFFWDPELYSLSLFWILFLEGCLFPLHLVIFLGFLSCPFIWDITFCLFMVILV